MSAGDYDDHTFSFSNTVTSPTVPSVPEPESWALMLAGLAAGGRAVRRKRTAG